MKCYLVIFSFAFYGIVYGAVIPQEDGKSTIAVTEISPELNETEVSSPGVVASTTLAPSVGASTTSSVLTTLSTRTTTAKPKEPELVKPRLEGEPGNSEEAEEKPEIVKQPSPTRKPDPSSSELEHVAKANDSNFLTILLIGGFISLGMYVVYHNKRKIMGMMFEGRGSGRNVRYRRLSQREDEFPSEIIY